MRNISSKFLTLLSVVSAIGVGTSAQAQLVWTVGLKDGGWPVGNGGGPNASFVQENGTINVLPGSPTSPETDQQADNDYYFAGLYSTLIPGNGYPSYVPVGVVAANEEAAERAFAGGDLDLRYHFNLPNALRPFDLLRVTFAANNLDSPGAVNTDVRFGIEVYFNGVLVQTQIVIRPAQLNTDFTTPQFKLSSVNAQLGAGPDNIVSLKGISYNAAGGGNWMGIDYVRLDSTPGAGLLPNVVNMGGNKVGTVVESGNGAFTIRGGGNDIWDVQDEFTYAYTEVVGDFDVQVRVDSLSPTAQWSKAGIMVRESLSEFSRMAFARVTPPAVPTGGTGANGQNDVRFAYRTGLDNVAGVSGGQHEDPAAGFPAATNSPWLRLIRTNTTFTMLTSSNGTDWGFLASQETTNWGGGAFTNSAFVGLGVSRHGSAASLTATGVFSGFKFNTNNARLALMSASTRGNPRGIRLNFNNPVGASGLNSSNYSLTAVSGTPTNLTVVSAVRFSTANDSPNRDPFTFVLEGTTADPAIGAWTQIATGVTGFATDPGRLTVGPVITFPNTTAYSAYRLIFPTVRDAATANSMQVADIELLDSTTNRVTRPSDAVIAIKAVPGSPVSLVAVAGTAANVNNFPAAENATNSIDNVVSTKYLNFAKTNTGIIVIPSVGVAPAKPTIVSAAGGPNTFSVQLTVSPLIEDATYILSISNVLGADGSVLGGTNVNNVLIVHGAGYEARRIIVQHNKLSDTGIFRNSDAVAKGIGDVTVIGGVAFPGLSTNPLFEDPVPDNGSNERFATRIAGVLVAPVSGNFVFACSSDDVGYLYLSSDANPANKVQIASEPVWNGVRQYALTDRRPAQENISAPKALEAGNRYYIEYVYTEGGGGNNGSVTWQPPGASAIVNGQLPINETNNFMLTRQFGGAAFASLGPVRITSHPVGATVTALLPITFRVGLEGTPGYTYQWRRNGIEIPGATGPSYTIAAAPLTDDQAQYSVVVANEFSSAISSNAVLRVLNPTPPHLTGAASDATFTTVVLNFDNRLDPAAVTNLTNYVISGGITVISATRDSTGRNVILRTTTLAQDTTYTVRVFALKDETGTQTLTPNPSALNFSSFTLAPGFVIKEYYQQFTAGAGSVDAFVTAQRAGTTPITQSCLTNIWEFNVGDQYDNYGGRMAAFFIPPVTGPYVFYFASDDFGRLFLSTDANPANVREIAREPVWANRREWVGAGGGGGRVGVTNLSGGLQANISGSITLTQGQRYYMESFFTEGGGGDNMGVAVQIPGGAVPVSGDPGIPGTMLATYVLAGNLAITSQPQSQTNVYNGFAQFTVSASGASAICGGGTLGYQWRSNGVVIAGATGPSLIVGPLAMAANGAVFTVNVTAPGRNLTSSNAVLTVNVDNIKPTLKSVKTDLGFKTIRLNWSELMDQGAAVDPSNYQLFDPAQNQLIIVSVDLVNGSNVVLHLGSILAPGTTYSLEIDGQTDIAGNQTAKVGNPQIDPDFGVVVNVRSFYLKNGIARYDAYVLGVAVSGAGNDPTAITTSSGYTNETPTFTYYTNQVFVPQTVPNIDNFGMRFRFFFTAPTTGTYKFEPSHDDGVDIYVATNGNPANAVNVFHENCCNGFGAGEGGWTNLMAAGQKFYFEVLGVEAGGGDNVGLSVTLPGGQYIAPITSQHPSAYADPSDPQLAGFTIGKASGNQLLISWTGGFCLQETSDLINPIWISSTRTNGVAFTPPTSGNKFYRLILCP